MNMQISEFMMSSPHNFPCILFTEMTKIPCFSYEKVKLALYISTLNKCRIMFALIYLFWYGDMLLHVWATKWKFSQFSIYKIHGKLWGDEINSLISIFISIVQEIFHWKLRKYKYEHIVSSFFFSSDLYQNFTVLFEMLYSFYWINLNLGRISPLTKKGE